MNLVVGSWTGVGETLAFGGKLIGATIHRLYHDKAGAGSSLHMRRFSEEDIVVGDVEIVLGILDNCSGISSSMDNMLEQLHNCQEEWKEHLLTISQGIL